MNETHLKIAAFFCSCFVWMYCINMVFIWLLCRRARSKGMYHLIFVCQALAQFPGLYFAGKTFETIVNTSPSSKMDGLIIGLIGLSVLLINVALSQIATAFSLKHFFPEKWKKFWEIRSFVFGKSDKTNS